MTGIVPRCFGKEPYETKARAIAARALRMKRTKHNRHPHKDKKRIVACLEPYHCDQCHCWHLGEKNHGKFS